MGRPGRSSTRRSGGRARGTARARRCPTRGDPAHCSDSDGDSSRRRREASLRAPSYGAVYGVVSQNGRRMYVVDTVDATEYALDLAAETRRLAVTPLMMTVNRRTIADQ